MFEVSGPPFRDRGDSRPGGYVDGSTESTLAASSTDSTGGVTRALAVRCWGTRGSIPAPGPATAGFGGNTPCVEMTFGDQRIIFDSGSGMRLLGLDLMEKGAPLDATIFLTHFHWDHIQGFPFFTPLYHPEAVLRIVGPMQHNIDIKSLFAGQMGPIYFPVPFSAVAARTTFDHLNEGSWQDGDIKVSAMRVRHPSFTVGYKVEAGGTQVCFIPDNELAGGEYEVTEGWRHRLLDFVAGSDLLMHDAMYTEEEYPGKIGWGHSTYQQALDLAGEAGVKTLLFYHHSPERTDEELNRMVGTAREEAAEKGYDLELDGAREGFEFTP